MTEIVIKGIPELQAKLRKLDKKHMTGALKTMGLHVESKAKPYPSAKPTYSRTFDLFRGWKVKPKASDFSVTVSNPTPYAPYVHGDKEQASFHRTAGWKRLAKTARDEMKELVNILKKQVDRILEGR